MHFAAHLAGQVRSVSPVARRMPFRVPHTSLHTACRKACALTHPDHLVAHNHLATLHLPCHAPRSLSRASRCTSRLVVLRLNSLPRRALRARRHVVGSSPRYYSVSTALSRADVCT
jgi:hypothetical protein